MSNSEKATDAAPAGHTTITLEAPLRAGKVTTVDVRKPKAGALRGANLVDLLQMDVAAASTVLPRVTTPALTEAEIRDMDPADLFQLASEIAHFLLPKHMQAG